MIRDVVKTLIASGYSEDEIKEYIEKSGKYENTKDNEIKDIIEEQKNEIKNTSGYDKEYEIGKAIIKLNELYKKSYTIQDYKGCLAIQKEINILLIYETKTKKTGKNEKDEIEDYENEKQKIIDKYGINSKQMKEFNEKIQKEIDTWIK